MYFGLEQLNYKRITEYMKIAELIIEEVLNSIIITFYNNEQEERLKAIIMAEGIFNNEMDMEIERTGGKKLSKCKDKSRGKKGSISGSSICFEAAI